LVIPEVLSLSEEGLFGYDRQNKGRRRWNADATVGVASMGEIELAYVCTGL
jgi:hypothetical protein